MTSTSAQACLSYTNVSHKTLSSHLLDDDRLCDDLDDNGYDDTSNSRRNLSDMSCVNLEVYMSLVWHGGHLGIAHYDLSSLQIHIMADKQENDDFSLVKQIVREVQPAVIVLSSLSDGRLLACLRRLISEKSPISQGSNMENCKLEFLPNSNFSYEVSKRRILSMNIPSVPKHFTEEERKFYFASLLSLDSTNMIRAVGGLLKYLEKSRVGVELEDVATCVNVLGFRVFTLENQLQMDMVTYCALNIFIMELHPSAYKSGSTSSSKEGLSLFGILNRCKSSIGSRMLRQWFLRPLRNASLLSQRYDAVSFFLDSSNMETMACLQGCLKHIKYIPRILLRMSKAQATIGDWMALSKTIYHAVYIGDICRAQAQGVEIFRKINTAFTDDLHRCTNLIRKTIDFEASLQNKRFVVQANVDDKLDEKKRTFNGLPDLMSRVAREELESLDEDIPECVVSYLPQIGYLLVIDLPQGKTVADDHTIDGLDYKFASNNQLFYKSPKTLELDRILGDIQLEISDLEVTIMHHLQDAILEHTQVLLNVMELAAELDCLMGLATCANEFGYVRPSLVEEDVLDIQAGRHPLQELCCSPYVPNPTTMGGRHSKIKLLTGPNACGKSIYLKQVALIVYMAHIGSFVPAEKASIGPVDKIFSRVKCMESVSWGMSTFMQDNVQVSEALHSATANSLVVIDEFGKGTECIDGQALLTAVLKFWLAKGPVCPLVLVSTHFHSIIQQKLLPHSTQLQFLTLDTVMNGSELVFLYQLKEGHTSTSCAANIAAKVGMSQNIIKRASEVSKLLSDNKSVPHIKDSNTELQNQRNEKIVSAFLKLNLETDDLHAFLKGYVLQMCKETTYKQQAEQDPEHVQTATKAPQMLHQGEEGLRRQEAGGARKPAVSAVAQKKTDTTQGFVSITQASRNYASNEAGSNTCGVPVSNKGCSTLGDNNISDKTSLSRQNMESDEVCDIAGQNNNKNPKTASLQPSEGLDLGREQFNKIPLMEGKKQRSTKAHHKSQHRFERESNVATKTAQAFPQTTGIPSNMYSKEGTTTMRNTDVEKRKSETSLLSNSAVKQAKMGEQSSSIILSQSHGELKAKKSTFLPPFRNEKGKTGTSSSTGQPESERTPDEHRKSTSASSSGRTADMLGRLASACSATAVRDSRVQIGFRPRGNTKASTCSSTEHPQSESTPGEHTKATSASSRERTPHDPLDVASAVSSTSSKDNTSQRTSIAQVGIDTGSSAGQPESEGTPDECRKVMSASLATSSRNNSVQSIVGPTTNISPGSSTAFVESDTTEDDRHTTQILHNKGESSCGTSQGQNGSASRCQPKFAPACSERLSSDENRQSFHMHSNFAMGKTKPYVRNMTATAVKYEKLCENPRLPSVQHHRVMQNVGRETTSCESHDIGCRRPSYTELSTTVDSG